MKTAQPLFDAVSEENGIESNVDGHTANRTDMVPWEPCGPECPVCAEVEK